MAFFGVYPMAGRWRNVPERFGQMQDGTMTGACLPLMARNPGASVGGRCRGKKAFAGEPADHALGRSQGGFGTKLHLIWDAAGTPSAVAVGPGQEHEAQSLVSLMEEALAWPEQPAKVAGDKGYSADWIRDWAKDHDIVPVIPYKSNEKGSTKRFDKKSYRRRNIVERCVTSLK
jgi:transposase